MCDKVLFLPQTLTQWSFRLNWSSPYFSVLAFILVFQEYYLWSLNLYKVHLIIISHCALIFFQSTYHNFNHMYLVPFLVSWKLHNNRNYVYFPYFCLLVFCLVGISIHLESLYSWLKNFLISPFPYCLRVVCIAFIFVSKATWPYFNHSLSHSS